MNFGIGIEYHKVDLKEFQKSPNWVKFVKEAGDAFGSYFCDRTTPVSHHFLDTLHLLITTMNVAAHMLVLAAQRVETVVEGFGIHALCHGLKCSGFEILAKNILSDANLKIGDKLKTFIAAECGKITDTISFDKASVLEFRKFIANKASGNRVKELFFEVCGMDCTPLQQKLIMSQAPNKGSEIQKNFGMF